VRANGDGRPVAERVAAILGYGRIRREGLVKASQRYGISEAKLFEVLEEINGGEGGIRTPGTLIRGTHDFQSCTFNRSVTSPILLDQQVGRSYHSIIGISIMI
jgi:hypothetical protein